MLLQIVFPGSEHVNREISIFFTNVFYRIALIVKLCYNIALVCPSRNFIKKKKKKKRKRIVRASKEKVKSCRYIEHDRSLKADNQITPGILPYCRVILLFFLVLQTSRLHLHFTYCIKSIISRISRTL